MSDVQKFENRVLDVGYFDGSVSCKNCLGDDGACDECAPLEAKWHALNISLIRVDFSAQVKVSLDDVVQDQRKGELR